MFSKLSQVPSTTELARLKDQDPQKTYQNGDGSYYSGGLLLDRRPNEVGLALLICRAPLSFIYLALKLKTVNWALIGIILHFYGRVAYYKSCDS